VRQIDFGDRGVGLLATSCRYKGHLSVHPMHHPVSTPSALAVFETSVGRQLHPARAASPVLGAHARLAFIAASAITRLSVLNLLLSVSGSGRQLTRDQGDSIDWENPQGPLNRSISIVSLPFSNANHLVGLFVYNRNIGVEYLSESPQHLYGPRAKHRVISLLLDVTGNAGQNALIFSVVVALPR
jgi:hypothetical protein